MGGAGDPGNSFNNLDLADLYALAGGSSDSYDLKKVRVSVNEHGEYGPVLGYTGQKFTDWESIGLSTRNAA